MACAFYVAPKEDLEDACVSRNQYLLLTSMERLAKELLDLPKLDPTETIAWMDREVFAACVSKCIVMVCVQTLLGTELKTTPYLQACGYEQKRL